MCSPYLFTNYSQDDTQNLYFEFGFFTETVDHALSVRLRNFEVQMLFLDSPFQSSARLVIFAFAFPQIQVICPSVQKPAQRMWPLGEQTL